jgi:hypothetical protein
MAKRDFWNELWEATAAHPGFDIRVRKDGMITAVTNEGIAGSARITRREFEAAAENPFPRMFDDARLNAALNRARAEAPGED